MLESLKRPRQESHRHVGTRELLPLLNSELTKARPHMSWDTLRSAPTCDLLLSTPKLYLLDFRVGGTIENSALAPVTYAFGLFTQSKTRNHVQNRKNISMISGFNLKRIPGRKSAPTAPWLLSQLLNRDKEYNSWLQPLKGNIFLEETLKGLPRKTA